jgi:hypothetical protein
MRTRCALPSFQRSYLTKARPFTGGGLFVFPLELIERIVGPITLTVATSAKSKEACDKVRKKEILRDKAGTND